MVHYLTRLIPVVARAMLGRDGRVVSQLSRRVRPGEIDLNAHMNQGAYLDVMELGRADWLLRSGALKRWRDAGINPIVANQHIEYRRELAPLQRYTLDTRATSVEGRLLCFEQTFLVGDRVHVRGDCRVLFVGPEGVLSPEQVLPIVAGLLTDGLAIEGWRVQSPG